MRLLLVRHGQTESNLQRRLDTEDPGLPLTELGRQQAEELPDALAHEPVRAVFSSTLHRAEATAAPLARALGLPLRTREGLREIPAGDLEMRNDDEAIETYLSAAMAWGAGDLDAAVPGGEPGTSVLDRYDRVVREAAAGADGDAVVLVSHGAVIRAWVAARSDNVDADFAARHWLSNTGVVALEGDPDTGWTVVTWAGDGIAELQAPGAPDGPAGDTVEPPGGG